MELHTKIGTFSGIITRRLPFRYVANLCNALSTAFVTASSLATLPLTTKNVVERNRVDPRISRYVEGAVQKRGQFVPGTIDLERGRITAFKQIFD